MKKYAFSFLCALLFLFPVTARAAVTSAFDDVSDPAVAAAVETLRVMGVLGGFSDGTFRPDVSLNRAQFCKMVILATGSEKELGRYSVITVFPDVKPSYWAASYINLAARGQAIIKGYSDGKFHPERTVTLGQAVTILMRLLGYKDEDMGGVWPDGYMAMAASTGLTEGVGDDASDALGRGKAAILFSNLLRADTASGAAFYSLSDETTLSSFDSLAGTLVTPDKTYDMETFRVSDGLVGSRGRVVLKDGKALTFLPTAEDKIDVPTGSVIVYANSSTRGFSAITGERNDYVIQKNGMTVSTGDLRTGDVATYVAATNVVSVCDTRLTAYYEDCYPSPDAPETVELLGGTSFPVLPTAADMLSAYRPGQVVTFLLAADGQIAGAVDADPPDASSKTLRGNAVFLRNDADGTRLLCGGAELPVKLSVPDGADVVFRLSWDEKQNPVFLPLSSVSSGVLDLAARKLGSVRLADNARIYNGAGELLSLSDFTEDTLPSSTVTASRVNWAGNVDLLILNGGPGDTLHYGRAEIRITHISTERAVRDENGASPDDDDWIPTYQTSTENVLALSVDCGGSVLGPYAVTKDNVQTGDFVAVRIHKSGEGFSSVHKLQKLESVAFSAWTGKTAVNAGGRTYSVPEDVLCYNRDNGRWMKLAAAKSYAKRAALYVEDGTVRALEVKS